MSYSQSAGAGGPTKAPSRSGLMPPPDRSVVSAVPDGSEPPDQPKPTRKTRSS